MYLLFLSTSVFVTGKIYFSKIILNKIISYRINEGIGCLLREFVEMRFVDLPIGSPQIMQIFSQYCIGRL